MAIHIHIHTTHRQFTKGLEVVAVQGKTVGDCLNDLVRQFPGMEKAIFAGKDKLHRVIEIFLNDSSAYPNELAKPVKDGDQIHLLVMLSGG